MMSTFFSAFKLKKKKLIMAGKKKTVLKLNAVSSQCSNLDLTTVLREKLEAHSG